MCEREGGGGDVAGFLFRTTLKPLNIVRLFMYVFSPRDLSWLWRFLIRSAKDCMHFRARLLSCVLLPASPWYRGVFVFPLQTHTICIYRRILYVFTHPLQTHTKVFTLPLQTHTPSVFGSISAEDKCFSAPNILPTSNGRHLYNGCQSDSLAQSYHSDHGFQPTVIPRAAGRC